MLGISLAASIIPHYQYPLRQKLSNPVRAENQILNQRENLPSANQECALSKMRIPFKQYSNKFLRESKQKDKEQENMDHAITPKRLSSLVRASKQLLQKKYNRVLTQRNQSNKTEPNDAEVIACPQFNLKLLEARVKTETMFSKSSRYCPHLTKGERNMEGQFIYQSCCKVLRRQQKNTKLIKKSLQKKEEGPLLPTQINSVSREKMFSSRGLQMVSKVFIKDVIDFPQKFCSQNKKKTGNINTQRTNLEACQIILNQKNEKYGSMEKKMQSKSIIKHRLRINSDIKQIFKEDPQQNFEIRGWETSN